MILRMLVVILETLVLQNGYKSNNATNEVDRKVTLPNGRTFYSKYKRVKTSALPSTVHIQKKLKTKKTRGN